MRERRRFPRFSGRLPVRFYVDDELVHGETHDLSVAGAFVVATKLPLVNRVLVVKVYPGVGQQAVTIEARVARTLGVGFGLEWRQATVPLAPGPLRSFLFDVLGVTQGFVKRLEDPNGVPRFVYRFSYEFLTRALGHEADAQQAHEEEAVGAGAQGAVAGAIPVAFSSRGTRVRARMVGGFDNGLVLQAEGEPVQNFDRLDIHVFPDDRRRRIDLKGLVSRVKPVEKGYKVYIRLTLDNDQGHLARFRDLASSLRT